MKQILATLILALSVPAIAAQVKFEGVKPTQVIVCGGNPSDYGAETPLTPYVAYSKTPFSKDSADNIQYFLANTEEIVGGLTLVGKTIPGIDTAAKAIKIVKSQFPGVFKADVLDKAFAGKPNLPYSVFKGEKEVTAEDGSKATFRLMTINGLTTVTEDKKTIEYSLAILAQISVVNGKKKIELQDAFGAGCSALDKSAVATKLQ